LAEAKEAVERAPSRSRCLLLLLAVDFGWQVVRVLGGRRRESAVWHRPTLPPDHAAIDADLGNDRYAVEEKIREDADWAHGLHSKLRHPENEHPDLLALLRDPPPAALVERLLHAASGVERVLLETDIRIKPRLSCS
jgi:hypothetical protein